MYIGMSFQVIHILSTELSTDSSYRRIVFSRVYGLIGGWVSRAGKIPWTKKIPTRMTACRDKGFAGDEMKIMPAHYGH